MAKGKARGKATCLGCGKRLKAKWVACPLCARRRPAVVAKAARGWRAPVAALPRPALPVAGHWDPHQREMERRARYPEFYRGDGSGGVA